jgi:hypothetical protein
VEAAIVPAILYYGTAFAIIGLLVGGTVAGWGSLIVLVAGLAAVAGVMNATFVPGPHGFSAGLVAFVGVFVVVGAFAVLSHLVRRRLARGNHTAV